MDPTPPPKLVETRPDRGPIRQAAWACALSNLMLPGLGTFLAQRRAVGVLQLVISQTGFVLSLLWAILFARDCLREQGLTEDVTAHLALGLTGATIFLFAWIWSLISSVRILLSTRKSSL